MSLSAVTKFQLTQCLWPEMQGLRESLQALGRMVGLLEMMFAKLSDWIAAFISDMEVC